jgi:hypothetical protein
VPNFVLYEVLPGIDVAFTRRWQLRLRCRASSPITVSIELGNAAGRRSEKQSEEVMLAWEPMSADKSSPEEQLRSDSDATTLLYRLTVAFPTWVGAILAVYSVFLYKSGALRSNALKIRLK